MPPPLDDVAQTGEWEVKGEHQGLLNRSSVQKSAPSGNDLLGIKIYRGIPFWLLKMD